MVWGLIGAGPRKSPLRRGGGAAGCGACGAREMERDELAQKNASMALRLAGLAATVHQLQVRHHYHCSK